MNNVLEGIAIAVLTIAIVVLTLIGALFLAVVIWMETGSDSTFDSEREWLEEYEDYY